MSTDKRATLSLKDKASLTLENFASIAALVDRRQEIARMIETDGWVPGDLARTIPESVMAQLGAAKLKADVVRLAYAAIGEIDKELRRHGFEISDAA